jgi:hypothetical protein
VVGDILFLDHSVSCRVRKSSDCNLDASRPVTCYVHIVQHWRLGIWQQALRFLQGCGGNAPSRALPDPQLGHVPERSVSILPDNAHGAPKTTLANRRACLVGTHAKNHPSEEPAGATDHWDLNFSLKLTINCGRNACFFTRTMVLASRRLALRRIKSSYQQE